MTARAGADATAYGDAVAGASGTGRPVRVGVVGLGWGGRVHVPALRAEGAEVVALCARRLERAQAGAERFGVPLALDSFDDLLSLDGLDAVTIATRAPLHEEMATAALAAGLHVLCEKPLAVDEASAARMWKAAEASDRTAMVGTEFRFASGQAYVAELLADGYLGRLRRAYVRAIGDLPIGPPPPEGSDDPQPYSPEHDRADLGGGLVSALGWHYVDSLRRWFGEVATVTGHLDTLSPDRLDGGRVVRADAEDTFELSLDFVAGGRAHMVAHRLAPFGSGSGVELYGTEGTLVMPHRTLGAPARGTVLGARRGDPALAPLPVPDRLQPPEGENDVRAMFRLLIRAFLRGIEEGTSPSPNFLDGYRTQQIVAALRRSSGTGRPVDLDRT
jgi:predicted dehydrogenase